MQGQVFSTDALMAVLLVLVFMGMALSASVEQKSFRAEISKERYAEDALATLDRAGILASGNYTLINASMRQLMPPNLNWSLNITTYNVNGSTLLAAGSSRYGYYPGEDADVFVSQRRFAAYSQGVSANVSVARMEVW